MAVTKTTRLGVTRWSADTDPWDRADFDADNAALEANAAMYAQGTLAARPVAAKAGRFYYATDNSTIYYDNGTTWNTHAHTMSDLPAAAAALAAYPVGAVYISVVSTSPATLFGGTWSVFATGRVLVSIDAGQVEFDTVEKVGGAKTHALTAAEMPSHVHSVALRTTSGGNYDAASGSGTGVVGSGGGVAQAAGGGLAHNNLQPFIAVHMWKRTA